MDYVYLLRCADGSLYTGWTTDPQHRLKMHNAGMGAKYTKSRRPVEMVYCEKCDDKSSALRREAEIKKLSRKEKLLMIEAKKDFEREMRRKAQEIGAEECEEVLGRCTSGVLGLNTVSGYPYTVPLSYAYADGKIYFHGATEGRKADAVKFSDKASFCVVDKDDVKPAEYTTVYRSVIAFGRMHILEGEEKRSALFTLAERYNPGARAAAEKLINEEFDNTNVMMLDIERMTGKASKRLIGK